MVSTYPAPTDRLINRVQVCPPVRRNDRFAARTHQSEQRAASAASPVPHIRNEIACRCGPEGGLVVEGRVGFPMVRVRPSKRKDEVMRSKNSILLSALLLAATSTAAFAQHAHFGGAGERPMASISEVSPGFTPNVGFGASSAGGSGGTPTGPTNPGLSGAVSGMNLAGTGVGASSR